MGLFSGLFGKTRKDTSSAMRDTLFGDMPLNQWPPDGNNSDEFPWSTFVTARSHLVAGDRNAAVECWKQIVEHPDLEPRHNLQAWHFLRQHGEQPLPEVAKDVLGVVVEVAMPKGLDLLAAYRNYSARYYNFSGAGIIWERPNDSLDPAIDELLAACSDVVAQIGPWEDVRPPAPSHDQARLCFLTPSGLHFGQGSMAVLSSDPLAARVLKLAADLMNALIAKSNAK